MALLELVESEELWVPNEGGQQEFFDDYTHPYVALAGGWYAGKTWAGARKLADLHVWNAFDAGGQPTNVASLVVGQTYGLATTINIPELRKAFDEMGLSYRFIADPKLYAFVLPDLGTRRNPSLIYVRSADAAETITGFTVGQAWGDEAGRWTVKEEDPMSDPFIQIAGRVRDPRAKVRQINFTFTHEGDATQIYADFEEKPKPGHVLYRAGSFENPHASDFVASMRQRLSPDLQAQYLGGKAVKLSGTLVYGAFEYVRNVEPKLVLDPALPLQLAIDFNVDPGMHAIVGQHFEGQDTITAVHELFTPDVPSLMTAFDALVGREGGWRWPELHLFGDASGKGKWAGSGRSCWDIVLGHVKGLGIPYRFKVPAANPFIADRVNAVNAAMVGFDAAAHYLVHPRCDRLIEDLRRMKWQKGELPKQDRKRSHASDADGYRIFWLRPIRRPSSSNDRVMGA